MVKSCIFKGSVEQYLDAVCEMPFEPLYYSLATRTFDDVKEFRSERNIVRIKCKNGVVYHHLKDRYIAEHSIDFGYFKENGKEWKLFEQYDDDDFEFDDEFEEENVDEKFYD